MRVDEHDGDIEVVEVLLMREVRVTRNEDVVGTRQRGQELAVLLTLEPEVLDVLNDEPGPTKQRCQLVRNVLVDGDPHLATRRPRASPRPPRVPRWPALSRSRGNGSQSRQPSARLRGSRTAP